MDPDFLDRIQRISLTAEEKADIVVKQSHREKTLEECSLSLLGRLLTDKPYNQKAAKNLFRSVWKLRNDVKIIDVGNGVYQFHFKLESQLRWVAENGPWSFDNHLLLWGLPFDLLNAEAAEDIGSGLGRVVSVDQTALSLDQASFLRVRVEIPLNQPLRRRGPVVCPKGERAWVEFRYERIDGLCFSCGRLGHETKTCTLTTPCATDGEQPYGDWLKAGGRRRLAGADRRSKSPPTRPTAKPTSHPTAPQSPRINSLILATGSLKGKGQEKNPENSGDRQTREKVLGPTPNDLSHQNEPNEEDADMGKPAFGPKACETDQHVSGTSMQGDVPLKRRQVEVESDTGAWKWLILSQLQRRRLGPSPADPNDHHELELQGAWEPPCSSSTCRLGEIERTHSFVSNGNEAVYTGNGTHKERDWLSFHASSFECSPKWRGRALMEGYNHGYQGYPYTWRNGRFGNAFVEFRLDRALVNLKWKERFPMAKVWHETASYSDHDPITLQTDTKSNPRDRRKKLQRFEEKWAMHESCEGLIRTSWSQAQPMASPMFRLFEKIKRCRQDLVRWSRETFGNTRAKLTAKQSELQELASTNYGLNLERINLVRKEVNGLLHDEEVFWRQCFRAIWLPAGDKNTKFFHLRASQRRRKNHIEGLTDEAGVWQADGNKVAGMIEEYYQRLFTTSNPTHMEAVLNSVESVVTNGMRHSLLVPYMGDEVRVALFQMHPSKALGPDGMSPFFFQRFWPIVGPDVTSVVLSVLHSGHCLRKMQHSHVVLIPKKPNPEYITEYQPISLGNVVARVVSKVLANRIKKILPSVISDSQSAFVPSRLITDNTSVAYEMLHRMRNRRKGKLGHMAVKLDISKAYDRVEWNFLKQIMLKIGLLEQWVALAMETATSSGQLNGIPSCRGGVQISHLLFADDSLLFCEATPNDCQKLLSILGAYEAASGQAVNRHKTSLFFSQNTRSETREEIRNMLGAHVTIDFDKYLGLPMVGGNSKVNTFKKLQEKITKRVLGWKDKNISKAGREVLIKNVAQAIPTYSMSLFKIPKTICDGINSALSKYWWGQTRNEKKIHWIKWSKLCGPKGKGGMGFRDIHAFNLAMLAKQAWRLLTETHSLFYRVYKARYFPSCTFMEAELGTNPSFVWRSLLQAREVITKGSIWEVGDGRSIGVSSHKWLPRPPQFLDGVNTCLKVRDLVSEETNKWNLSLLTATFTQSTVKDILRCKKGALNSRDSLKWKESKNRVFSVRTAYHVALRLNKPLTGEHSLEAHDQRMWKKLWSLNIPPKVRTFIWRACLDVLPTKANLARRKVRIDDRCSICCQQSETTCHILWECPLARNVWALVRGKLQKSNSATVNFLMLARQMMERLDKKELEVWSITAWSIWNARNRAQLKQVQTHPTDIYRQAFELLEEYQRLAKPPSGAA
ncbi:uncharacterized protein LOC142612431 [Castanea sativa]|uniref:uncharacterized protein LOC142612431 n=1 Tax=Castanea sativa TaxID=21020 RepID=UPI003F64C870